MKYTIQFISSLQTGAGILCHAGIDRPNLTIEEFNIQCYYASCSAQQQAESFFELFKPSFRDEYTQC